MSSKCPWGGNEKTCLECAYGSDFSFNSNTGDCERNPKPEFDCSKVRKAFNLPTQQTREDFVKNVEATL